MTKSKMIISTIAGILAVSTVFVGAKYVGGGGGLPRSDNDAVTNRLPLGDSGGGGVSTATIEANLFERLMNEPVGELEQVLWRDSAARLVRSGRFTRLSNNTLSDLDDSNFRNQAENATGTWSATHTSYQIRADGTTGVALIDGGVIGVRPGEAPGYLFADGNVRTFHGFKISAVGTDAPNFTINFGDTDAASDDNLEDWENLVLLFRLESPDGLSRFYGALPLGADTRRTEPRIPDGDPYNLRNVELNKYLELEPAGTDISNYWDDTFDGRRNVLWDSIKWLNENTPKFINADGTGNPIYSAADAAAATNEQNAAARVKVVFQLVRAEVLEPGRQQIESDPFD